MLEKDTATLSFTNMKVENEIKEIWEEIKLVRNDVSIPEPIRAVELARLFDVQNDLVIESTYEQESYLKLLLKSLDLDNIGGRPMTDGKLKCHLMPQRKQKMKSRSTSCGFIDNISNQDQNNSGISKSNSFGCNSSGILLQTKSDIRFDLLKLSTKKNLTKEEMEEKEKLSQLSTMYRTFV